MGCLQSLLGQFTLFNFRFEFSVCFKQLAGALLYQVFEVITVFLQFRFHPFTFLNFIFDGRDIFVAGPFPAIPTIRAIHRLADVTDPAFPVIPGDDAKLAGLNFSPNPFGAEMIRDLIPVKGVNDLIQQTGVFQKGLRAIPGYSLT